MVRGNVQSISANAAKHCEGQAIQSIASIRSTREEPAMLQVALLEPEIPPNTGNIARLCAAVGCPLHLVGRLGFRIDDKAVKRAGLDYWQHVQIVQHAHLSELEGRLKQQGANLYCLSARAGKRYTQIPY